MAPTVPQGTLPRLTVAGLAGDTGKTLVSTGLVRALRRRGLRVAPFKKGPDYIDSAWLTAAAGEPARNLDTFLMPATAVCASLGRAARQAEMAIIEGNRGLFDGMDAQGTHSTAQLARLTGTPIVLVVNTAKATRTVAAQILGCQMMDPKLNVAAVILNRVASPRHEAVIREAIAGATEIPVVGAIPRQDDLDLPSRHLGLVPVAEHPRSEEMLERAADLVEQGVDLSALLTLAMDAPRLEPPAETPRTARADSGVRIGVARDVAFSFYYPENLEELQRAGADLIFLSPIADQAIPDVDGFYIGGGFPEVFAGRLSANRLFREELHKRIADGLPVWAECGGLMYLAKRLIVGGVTQPMVGALPIIVEQTSRPQGHGYVSARVDSANPFLPEGTVICGHEFHYSHVTQCSSPMTTTLAVERGIGIGRGRDGIQAGNTVAAYTHIHAAGLPGWAPGIVKAAQGVHP
jgi:cobyrinic acid a,c-diamide synthase